MNILLMKLKETNGAHCQFAESVLDELLTLIQSEKYTHLFVYVNQIEHRCKVRRAYRSFHAKYIAANSDIFPKLRMVCAIMLLLRFINEDNVEKYLKLFFEGLKKETMVSIRSYLEVS